MPAPQKRPQGSCDALSPSVRAIARTPLLSAAEEISLARQVQKGLKLVEVKEEITIRSGGAAPCLEAWALAAGMTQRQLQCCLRRSERARSRMVMANLRLVISLARRYQHRPCELEDLIQEGTIGLLKAVERFDPSRGYRFSTYATWWIRESIGSALINRGRTIRLPSSMVNQLNQLRQCQQRLGQQLGRDPSLGELAEATGLNPLDIREVLFRAQEPLSLDAQSGSGSEQRLMETLACRSSNPQDQLAKAFLQDDIARVFQELADSEATLLRFRYGLDAEKPLSLSATARRMGISRDSARGLERRANAAVRQLSRDHLSYLEA
ncbi:MAG: sigma-70 family RNA polymerase sigma factor [Cyanobacteriota bacterium]|nr:sigma-70 family RNA polymerase sigma factor [Cyanobacteriota bacterium]